MSKTDPIPTESELTLLNVLWEQGPSTVHEIRDTLGEEAGGYTTVLKLLQIMFEKGLVEREKEGRAHRYSAGIPQKDTQERLLSRLVNRAFGGSMNQLLLRALSSEAVSDQELREIRALMKDADDEDEHEDTNEKE